MLPYPVSNVIVHILFSTRNREPVLRGEIRDAAYARLDAVAKHNDCPPIVIGGAADHVHILCHFAATVTAEELIRELKEESASWIRSRFPGQKSFAWQESDGIFSVSECDIERMTPYIQKQEEYHRFMSFQDEFRMILVEHGVEWDEKETWE